MNDEHEFMNPMSKQMGKSMKAIIKKKVVSALCNEESVTSYKKRMFDEDEGYYAAPKRA